jgi:sugar lactone lactonase YvrE
MAGINSPAIGTTTTSKLAGDTTYVKKYYTNAGAVTDGIIWSPAAGKRWYVTDIFIQVSAASTVTLEDDLVAGDSAIWKAELAANSGWSHSFTTPWFSGEDGADLLVTSTAANIFITVTGYET